MALQDRSLREGVIAKAGGRCHVCGYPFEAALVVHHIVPIEFGGRDRTSNLVCVCENCHKLIHIMSAKTPRLPVAAKEFAPYGNYQKLSTLARRARDARLELQGASWTKTKSIRKLTPLDEAAETIARLNKYSADEAGALHDALHLVLSAIPLELRKRCSFRTVRSGHAVSVAIMNYLLFRAPAGSVMASAAEPTADCWLLWPAWLSGRRAAEALGPIGYEYSECEAVLVWLLLEQISELTTRDWQTFGEACYTAAEARGTRPWSSNIDPSAAWKIQRPPRTSARPSCARAKKA